MDAFFSHQSTVGSIKVAFCQESGLSKPTATGICPTHTYTWSPPASQAASFMPNYRLTMYCFTDSHGGRSFVPQDLEAMLLSASTAGFALLSTKHSFAPAIRFSYHAMRLFFRWSRLFSEYLGRVFNHRSDLYVRSSSDGGHILPTSVGCSEGNVGERWTPHKLVEIGKTVLQKPNATESDWIRCGLFAAARRYPIDPTVLSTEEASAMVQMALFDFSPSITIATEKSELIEARLLEMLEDHSELEADQFRKWFFKNISNIVHAISKRKTGGKLSRKEVRTGLLSLAWRSYRYVGDSVAAQMQAFSESLPTPLTPNERSQFAALYAPKSCWGGFPFVMLHERFGFIREAAMDYYANPAIPQTSGVILRLLQWYSEMARTRREADRETKRRKGKGCFSYSANDLVASPRVAPQQQTETLALYLLSKANKKCRCDDDFKWKVRFEIKSEVSPVTVAYECDCCQVFDEVEMDRADFEMAARVYIDGTESKDPS